MSKWNFKWLLLHFTSSLFYFSKELVKFASRADSLKVCRMSNWWPLRTGRVRGLDSLQHPQTPCRDVWIQPTFFWFFPISLMHPPPLSFSLCACVPPLPGFWSISTSLSNHLISIIKIPGSSTTHRQTVSPKSVVVTLCVAQCYVHLVFFLVLIIIYSTALQPATFTLSQPQSFS